jgi:hypothetical protein
MDRSESHSRLIASSHFRNEQTEAVLWPSSRKLLRTVQSRSIGLKSGEYPCTVPAVQLLLDKSID